MINPFFDLERKLEKLMRVRLPVPSAVTQLLISEWVHAHRQLARLEWQQWCSRESPQASTWEKQSQPLRRQCRQIGGWLRTIGPDGVEPSCRRYAGRHPTAATYYHLACLWEDHLGRRPIVTEFLSQAVDRDPEHFLARRMLAQLLYGQPRQRPLALPHYQKILSRFPQELEAIQRVAQCLLEAREYQAALPYFRQAVALNPDNAALHDTLATLLWPGPAGDHRPAEKAPFHDAEAAVTHSLRVLALSDRRSPLRQQARCRLEALREEGGLSPVTRQKVEQALAPPPQPSPPSKEAQMVKLYDQWVSSHQELLALTQRCPSAGDDGQWQLQEQIQRQAAVLDKAGRRLRTHLGRLPNKLKSHLQPELERVVTRSAADATEAAKAAAHLYHLAVFLHRYYPFDGRYIGRLCQQAAALAPGHAGVHCLWGQMNERWQSDKKVARGNYEAALLASEDHFLAHFFLAGLSPAFKGESAIQTAHRQQAMALLKRRQREVYTLQSAQDELAAACNAFFNHQQTVNVANVQMSAAGLLAGVAAWTCLLDGSQEQVAGAEVDQLVSQLLERPAVQQQLVSFPRIYWPVEVIKQLLHLMCVCIEFTLAANHPGQAVSQQQVDRMGAGITAVLRGKARLFRSNEGHDGWFRAWWRQWKIDRFAQYDETGSWKGLMGGRFVTSSKHPDDWESPW